jgi:HEAT repeat protein
LRCFPAEAGQVVPALAAALEDSDVSGGKNEPSVAEITAVSLERLGPAARAAVPKLLKTLNSSKDNSVRHWCLRAVGTTGAGDKVAIEGLVKILKDKEQGDLRPIAAFALGRMKAGAASVVSDLLEVLQKPGITEAEAVKRLRGNILFALQEIGPGAEPAVPSLMAILRDTKLPTSERQYAADALGNIGRPARVARPLLLEVSNEKKGRVSVAARRALDKIPR